MQDSKFSTLAINAVGGRTPTIVAKAAVVTLRVVVRNVGAGIVFLASEPGDVDPTTGPSTGSFRLPPGTQEAFVLTPKSTLFALAVGAGALLAISASEAIPFDFRS